MPKPSPGREPDPMAGVVDRLLAQLPGLQDRQAASRSGPRPTTQFGVASTTMRVHSATPREWMGVWARVLLGLALGIMMAGWPYLGTCGLPLFGYLGATVIVIVAGGWAACAAWRFRIGLAHIVSLVVVFYGVMLVVAELLPRTGYAVDQAVWQCEDMTLAPSWSAFLTHQSVRISI